MARLTSNPLTLPRLRLFFQVSHSAHLFKSPFLSLNRICKFQPIACQTKPSPTETEPSDKVGMQMRRRVEDWPWLQWWKKR